MRQGPVAACVLVALGCGSLREATDSADAGAVDAGPTVRDGGSSTVDDAGTTPGSDAGAPFFDLEWAMWPLPPASPANGDYALTAGTVLDEHTRLVWEREPPSAETTLDAARARCAALVVEGQDAFRLPTRIELLSLVDYGRGAPAMNPLAFSAAQAGTYWTTSADATDAATKAWTVAFGSGTSSTAAATSTHRSRCVRGTPAPRAEYTLTTDAVLDPRTGLTWQRRLASAGQPWVQAIATCQAATTDGKTGWRLPTARELESLVDVRRAIAPAWSAAFDAETAFVAWSITDVPGDASRAVVVDFDVAHATSTLDRTAQAAVRCVTGP